MSTLILVGGLPGSGKSTIAEVLHAGLHVQYAWSERPPGDPLQEDEPKIVSADDFFYVADDEPHCGYEILNDPSLLRSTGFARYRVGRSLRKSLNPPFDKGWSYRFEPALLAHAHTWCIEQVRNELARTRRAAIVVHNTFTQRWEMEPYLQLAEAAQARVHVTRLFDGGCDDQELTRRNSHGVPTDIITKMRGAWETDWRNGDPLPPWERESPE